MDVYCDNQEVVKNTSIPEFMLNKNHNYINYHVIHKTASSGILRVKKEYAATNLAESLTKLMPYYRKNDLLEQIGIIHNYLALGV